MPCVQFDNQNLRIEIHRETYFLRVFVFSESVYSHARLDDLLSDSTFERAVLTTIGICSHRSY